ncbi:MAG: hypothetical protein AMDU1_APLC00031G0002 [Thermoplasmatales archaeon A-plasma]|nr:MAG: hypothetical protein AMDU1_APLC00031G0002 [Thermoplasmatales archaeon A-plasma]
MNNSEGTRDDLKINETAPPEWRIVKLSEVADVVSGYGFPLKYQGKEQGTYPFVKVGDMNLSDKYVNTASNFVGREELKQLHAKVFPSGTTIFPKIGMAVYLNKFRILSVEATFDNNVAGIVPRRIHDEFLYYYFVSRVDLKAISNITTMPSIKKSTLENLQIPCPSLNEQQRIAEILSTADEAIQMVNDQITQTEHLKKGLMQTLLTKGIGHTKFKMTEIGEIPEEWPLRPFSEVLQIRKRKNEGKSEKIYTIPMELIPQNETYCGYRSLNKSEVVPPTYCECGDILLPKITPSVENGKQGIVPTMPSGNAFATSEVYALFTNGSLTNIYTFYLLKLSLFRKPLIDSMVGTTGRQRVPKDSLFNLSFPVPPIPEQQKISEILTTIDHKLELLRSKKTHLEELKKGMMEELLTGRVRVKI